MRSIFIGIMMIYLGILAAGCAGGDVPIPDDFALSFAWNTGSLPPKYHYGYVITIGPGAQGELDYSPGYSGKNDKDHWVASFTLTDMQLEELYAYLRDQNIIHSNWDSGDPLIGGSMTSLIITAYGKESYIPSISKLKGEELERVEAALEVIRGYVPEEIWLEMKMRQMRFEENFEG